MTFKYPKTKIVYDLLDQIKSSFFMLIIVFVINFNNDSTFINVVRIIFISVIAIALFGRLRDTLFTKVEFDGAGVHMYTGIFSKSERFIPREKFENIQTQATVLQRLFKVHKVTMETGDATGDVTLDFVTQSQLQKIEAYVLSERHTIEIEIKSEDDQRVLFTPMLTDLIKASLTSFSFLAIVPIAWNLWDDFKIGRVTDFDNAQLPVWLMVILVLMVIVVALAIGVIKTFSSYYKYKISMDDTRIYVQKGWFSKQSFSIRKEKVQAVVYKQSWYQKLLRVTTVRLISTGEIMASEEQQINEFFPYLPTATADAIVAEMLPQFTRTQMTHMASTNAKKLIWLRPPLFAIVVAFAGLWQWIFYVVAGIILVLTYISRILAYRNLAFTLDEQHVQVRSGGFTVETIVTKRPKLIEVEFVSSLMQRRFGVMTMKLANRAQPIHISELKDIDHILQPQLTAWFEQRAQEVVIDPKSQVGALKKEAVLNLVNVLKAKGAYDKTH